MNNRELAYIIAQSPTYSGGCTRRVVQVEYTTPNSSAPRPLHHLRHTCTQQDPTPVHIYIANNKRALARAPVGTVVTRSVSEYDGYGGSSWTKVGPCRWEVTDDWWESTPHHSETC